MRRDLFAHRNDLRGLSCTSTMISMGTMIALTFDPGIRISQDLPSLPGDEAAAEREFDGLMAHGVAGLANGHIAMGQQLRCLGIVVQTCREYHTTLLSPHFL